MLLYLHYLPFSVNDYKHDENENCNYNSGNNYSNNRRMILRWWLRYEAYTSYISTITNSLAVFSFNLYQNALMIKIGYNYVT